MNTMEELKNRWNGLNKRRKMFVGFCLVVVLVGIIQVL